MKEITKEKDEWGQWVIYVYKCNKFKYEHPDTIKNDLCKHNLNGFIKSDIIDKDENYF